MEPHPVLKLIRNRLRDGTRPGERNDQARLGLAVEGGGMRGVVSAGMLMELADLGLRQAFDAVYGASAGAINGAYFLAAKPQPGIGLYQQLNNSEFINLGRLAKDREVLDLDFLFARASSGTCALDCGSLLKSAQELRVVATSLKRLCPVALGDFSDQDELFQSLRASATVPFLTRSPLPLGDDLFVDGSILEAVPYGSAIKGGCTHVLALLSKPLHGQERPHGALRMRMAAAWLESVRPGLGAAYQSQALKRTEEMGRYVHPGSLPPGPPFVYVVEPAPQSRVVRRLEKSLPRLVAGAWLGRQAVKTRLRALAQDKPAPAGILDSYPE